MDISVVVPLFNEEESLPELTAWIDRVMAANHFSYEIILVDDGSKDNSWKVIEELKLKNTNISAIKFRRNYGKSAALNVGFAVRRVMWLLQWTRISKIARMRSLNCMIGS